MKTPQMSFSICGYPVRYTDAVYDDHLIWVRGTVWVGKGGRGMRDLIRRVTAASYGLPGQDALEQFMDLVEQSIVTRHSVPWSELAWMARKAWRARRLNKSIM